MYERVDIDHTSEDYGLDDFLKPPEGHWFRYNVYLPIYRFVRWKLNPAIYYRHIKYFIQRGRRGYSEVDAWGIGLYTMRLLRDGICDSMQEQYGYPVMLMEQPMSDSFNMTEYDKASRGFEHWQAIQSTILYGLDHYIRACDFDETCTCCGKYCIDNCPIVQESMELLLEWWGHLGD